MFERAMQHLALWWSDTFFEVLPSGHIRNQTWDEVQPKLESFASLYEEGEPDDETLESVLGTEIERIRGPKSLMKHALNRYGSRDVSAQLFTSLCRALGIPARLVVSLQAVPWQSSVGKPKPKYVRKDPKGKGKGKAKQVHDDDEQEAEDSTKTSFAGSGQRLDGTPVPKSEKAKGKERENAPPVIKLRKQKDKGRRLGSSTPSTSTNPSRLRKVEPIHRFFFADLLSIASPDPTTTPPVFWTEVFSRPDSRWMPVDPVRAIVNKRKAFDPTPHPSNVGTSASAASSSTSLLPPRAQPQVNVYSLPKNVKQENRMLYVVAFEEDGFGRDVTRRYARDYNAKVAKHQGGSSAGNVGGKARQAWWESVLNLVKRPYQLHRDDVEDAELATNQIMEGMPTTMAGFKDHPLYVLARHLKQVETIHPPPPETPEVGKFRGEPVYPRSSVVSLKSAETWMRTEGRIIKAGSQPLKTIKARPNTVNRVRELEVLKDELRDAGHSAENIEVTQGLYARSQTELYIPPPIVDGKIPKNNFGNLDLYVPTMLPKGAAHVPFKGTAKIAKKLGFDFAEAVTGFEFRKRRANAVIQGVVVAAENEAALLEAYWEAQRAEDEKARAKKEEKALQHWIKLVQGLRIRQRLQDEYADRGTPKSSKSAGKRRQRSVSSLNDDADGNGGGPGFIADDDDAASHHAEGGGFLVEADDVVQAFKLPKYNPLILASSNNLFKLGGGERHGHEKHLHENENENIGDPTAANGQSGIDYVTYDLDEEPHPNDTAMDVDMAIPDGGIPASQESNAPKTMQELLDAEKKAKETAPASDDVEVIDMHPVSAAGTNTSTPTTRLRARPQPKPSGSDKPIAASRPSRTVSAKKRKRGRGEDDDRDESGEEQEGDADEATYSGEDEPGVDDEEDEDDAAFGTRKSKKKKSPRKKARAAPKTHRITERGYIFISADYRLLPPATGHDIIEDIKDLWAFLTSPDLSITFPVSEAPRTLKIDSDAIAVGGSSAGGFCAYMAAMHCKNPKPKAILSIYALGGHIFTSYYLSPKKDHFVHSFEWLDKKDYEEFVYPYTKGLPATVARSLPAYAENHPLGPSYPANPRMQLVWLNLQYGELLDYMTGQHDPSFSAILRDACQLGEPSSTSHTAITEAAKELQEVAREKIDERHKRNLFAQFNVSSDWPSVVFVHGVCDTGLPLIDSEHIYGLLKDAGVPTEIYRMDGEEHAFDYLEGAEKKWGREFDQAIAFVHQATVKNN
ncbi:hypothetical protein H1R20_g2864, partial [Candolleomyces eurysporus]